MFTLGYSFRPWEDEKSIADGASILQYIKDTAAESGIDKQIRFNHRIVSADWSTERRSLDDHRGADRHRRDGRADVRLHVLVQRLLPLRPRLPAGLRRHGAFEGTIVQPQALARGPRLRRQAGRGDRQRCNGGHADPVAGRDGGARDDAAALALVHHVAAGRRTRSPNFLRQVLPVALVGPAVRWFKALARRACTSSAGAGPSSSSSSCARRPQRQLPPGYDVDTHFTPKYNPWDQRLCLVPDGDLFKAISDGSASVVTDHIDTFTETGILLEVRRRARGGHHRHRHRARAALHRRHRDVGGRRGRRSAEQARPTRA